MELFPHPHGPTINPSRRRFLKAVTGSAAALIVTGMATGKSIKKLSAALIGDSGAIRPPGALDRHRFINSCTGCHACAAVCPAKAIRPSRSGFGPVRLDYSRSGCRYDCTKCNAACPTGALRRLTLLDKQWLKIGEAAVDESRCTVYTHKTECTLCADACPKGAILLTPDRHGIKKPVVAGFHCIGCGACQAVCPAPPGSICVMPIDQQRAVGSG
jgi:ferredoxin-type protein NapF